MGGNARERHGLFRFGAFVAARVHRPPQHQYAKSSPRCGGLKRIIERCKNPTQERTLRAAREILGTSSKLLAALWHGRGGRAAGVRVLQCREHSEQRIAFQFVGMGSRVGHE